MAAGRCSQIGLPEPAPEEHSVRFGLRWVMASPWLKDVACVVMVGFIVNGLLCERAKSQSIATVSKGRCGYACAFHRGPRHLLGRRTQCRR